MREELVEPGPRWVAALRYLGLPPTTQASPAALPEIVLAIVERLEQVEAKLDAQNRPRS
jgi:hypothetical protein